MLSWPDEPGWTALFAPIRGVVDHALARLELPPVRVVGGASGGPLVVPVEAGVYALDPALLGPAPFHPADAAWRASAPEEATPLALDRWRRAAAALLEAAAYATLPEQHGAPPWWRAARAAEAADRAAPALGMLWPDLADLYAAPEAGLAPGRRAAWYARWLYTHPASGDAAVGDATAGAPPASAGGAPPWAPPSPEQLSAFAAWLFDPGTGPAAAAPVPLSAPVAAPGPWEAAPLSFRRVRVDTGPAGARLTYRGVAGPDVALVAGETRTAVLAALTGGEAAATVAPLGPVGTWALRSGRTGTRFGAARGIELQLRDDGTGEVTLADAFVGPATEDALSLAAHYGVSGTLVGRWKLVGHDLIELGAVRPVGVTVHPRGRFGFAIPAGPILGRAEGWLARVPGTRWRLRHTEEGLEVDGEALGPTLVLRFAPA